MDIVFFIILLVLIALFIPFNLAGTLFNKQDYDDSRVILPR